jgi:hypothetical protein
MDAARQMIEEARNFPDEQRTWGEIWEAVEVPGKRNGLGTLPAWPK